VPIIKVSDDPGVTGIETYIKGPEPPGPPLPFVPVLPPPPPAPQAFTSIVVIPAGTVIVVLFDVYLVIGGGHDLPRPEDIAISPEKS
jgi:hypothetical protein